MTPTPLPPSSAWGHTTPPIGPDELVESVRRQATVAVKEFTALPDGPLESTDSPGYFRVAVTIPLDAVLFDQLMNGPSGYRAHYSVSVTEGEQFNRRLVEAVAPVIVRAEHLYRDQFDQHFCERSLFGTYSKFWFPKEFTDPSASDLLLKFKDEICVPHWREYWSNRPTPRKGLLAPMPEHPAVLLNGTFINEAGIVFEQKPGRSLELHGTGWT